MPRTRVGSQAEAKEWTATAQAGLQSAGARTSFPETAQPLPSVPQQILRTADQTPHRLPGLLAG